MTPSEASVYGSLVQRNYLPQYVYVQIARRCNLTCKMCGHAAWKRNTGFMPQAIYDRVLAEVKLNKIPALAFSGAQGEPLLCPQAREYTSQALEDPGLREIIMNTNCTPLGERNIAWLVEAAKTKRFRIQCSFSGYDKASHESVYVGSNFERTSGKLKGLCQAFVQAGCFSALSINGIILDGSQPAQHRGYLMSLGIDPTQARFHAPDNFAGLVPNDRTLKETHLCEVLTEMMIVYDDGLVSACACRDSENAMPLGDIMKQSLRSMRDSPTYRGYVRAHLDKQLASLPLCSKCDIACYGVQ